MSSSLPPRPTIRVRRPELQIGEDAPKYFYRGEKGVTALLYALSAVFPDGERMFIDAVQQHRGRVSDPDLLSDVRAFAGQEAQHGRLHEDYNAYASSRGFRVEPITAGVRRRTGLMKQHMNPAARLATTAALEHFTALLAEVLLTDDDFFEGVDAGHAALWRWHALEEAEHKAVAFDVFTAVGGSQRLRRRTYVTVSLTFPTLTLLHTLYLMHHDGTLWDARAHWGLARFCFAKPGVLPKLLPGWLDYLRADFHPWSRDNRASLRRADAQAAPSA